jgi:hypothetical protein
MGGEEGMAGGVMIASVAFLGTDAGLRGIGRSLDSTVFLLVDFLI